ncbi:MULTISPECIES: SDR family oxidoreductase [Pseudomonas]|uniref:Oxidoreductase n=1 Tax=Pseudomonas cichorii TaxID=36746 RepID=A0A3M4VJD0_PSECI|nr:MULTISPECIES: SDR family oxidoreductase [Pseudomonas]AHF67909.1 short-chain dehydrogenase/reductase SDR [Pseudomonas cichorii JBC1]QVE14984.1 SDR family oxidoreductase [Pseudomonas cichorii]RMR51944.1 Short-chain dehydrogenase/reductase SDR [Pseudomonas cichorii]SDO67402.1 NADP-dependent 3-hydroxy acid dehydrogenase YdfG [Pseudomonas cichorii]GFM75314.1 oxidoreductase [Pseudomonas cichorii]
MVQEINNKVVVITGASSGLGAETARHLVQAGANVVLGARRLDRLQALARELGLGDESIVQTDVVDHGQVQALVARAVEIHGRIDVLINNAGVMPLSPLEMQRVEEWDQTIDVNIKGVLYGISAALPYMKEQKSGQIINVSSVAGHIVSPGGVVYSASKFAVRAISEGLRQEVKPYNIRSTILSPGAVDTELPASTKAEGMAQAMHSFYEHNAIPASSFARCVLFAISQPEEVDINEIVFRPTRQAF